MSEAAKVMLPDSRICGMCGKEFTVLYPDLWRYHRQNEKGLRIWMCSWKCLREYEAKKIKETKEKRKIRKELEQEGDELANTTHREPKEVAHQMLAAMENGEEARVYLKRIGYANPTDQLKKLRNWAEKNDPKIAERLKAIPKPKPGPRSKEKKPAAVVMKKLPEEARPKPKDGGEWEQAEGHGPVTGVAPYPEHIERIDLQIVPEQFTVTNIESKATTARYSFYKDINVFTLKMGMDQISLSPEDWKKLLEEIPEAMKMLGVEK